MKWIKKIIGDNHQLKGPDIPNAPTRTIDLSGTLLTIPKPHQTLMIPSMLFPDDYDIHHKDTFEHYQRGMSVQVYKNGWKFKGKWFDSFGYVQLNTYLTQYTTFPTTHSYFNRDEREKHILEEIDAEWGEENREYISKNNGIKPSEGLWRFPLKREQLHDDPSRNATYYHISLSGADGIKTYYCLPIGDQFILRFSFTTDPLQCDFFSPEHNLPEAAEKCVKDFMNSVIIKLSPEAEAQKKAAQLKISLTDKNSSPR